MNPIASHHNRPRLGRIRGLAVGLAAAGLVAGCSLTASSPSPTTMASASPSAVSSSLEPAAPTPGSAAATFTTSGVTSNWTGFSWSQLPSDNPLVTADRGVQVIAWQRGYVAYGTTSGRSSAFVWTSADGQTWTEVTAFAAPNMLVAASPAGLVAVAGDPSATVLSDGGPFPSETVWTSSDGVQWRNAGSPSGLAFVDSIAGTSSGLVAVQHTVSGYGKFATSQYSVVYSSDGSGWTPVTVDPGLSWIFDPARSQGMIQPQVQAGNNRWLLLFTDAGFGAESKHGAVWWSDDGRTWTRSTGTISQFGTKLDFGRDGILLPTNTMTVGGGAYGLDISADGGKSWKSDDKFGPLGATTCGQGDGECFVGGDGVIASNGTIFVAVKSNSHAWISYDGHTWTTIAWNGPSPSPEYGPLVLPRGVVVGSTYGAAQ